MRAKVGTIAVGSGSKAMAGIVNVLPSQEADTGAGRRHSRQRIWFVEGDAINGGHVDVIVGARGWRSITRSRLR